MKFLFLFTLLITSGCLETESRTPGVPIQPQSLSWSNEIWSKHIQSLFKSKFLDLSPRDINEWCPKYSTLLVDERVEVLSEIMVQMARYESNFNPRATYVEKFTDKNNKNVISSGLFQLSVESATQKRYECTMIKTQEDLFDPLKNITCAFNIMAFWIQKDGVISDSSNKGGSRYWSVLRPSSKAYPKIKSAIQNLGLCKLFRVRAAWKKQIQKSKLSATSKPRMRNVGG